MEGVLVGAHRTGSTITTTVVTDQHGRYAFPRARLEAGEYTIRIRAIGYDLESAVTARIAEHQTATADLKLRTTSDLASQLKNAEWLASMPGTEEQKTSVRGCAHCHTLSLVTRSRHDATEFVAVIERMAGYPPLAFPLMPQKTPAPRIGGGAVQPERQRQARARQAEHLSRVNLSASPQWSYGFQTLPRPKGLRISSAAVEARGADRHPRDAVRPRSESVAGSPIPGRNRQVRQEDRTISDVEPAAGI
jgi:hypothetical protein